MLLYCTEIFNETAGAGSHLSEIGSPVEAMTFQSQCGYLQFVFCAHMNSRTPCRDMFSQRVAFHRLVATAVVLT